MDSLARWQTRLSSHAAGLLLQAEEEALFEVAVEAGAEDVVPGESEDEGMRVVCGLGDYAAVRAAVAGSGVEVIGDRSGLAYVPNAPVEVDDDALAVCEAMVERLLEVDDVDAVYSNCAGLATN